MAFIVPAAAALTGASVSQLHNWRRTDLLVPEIESAQRPLLYSFRDVIALRTVVKLRREKSLQKIRRAFANAADVDLTDHPSEWNLIDVGPSIHLVRADGGAVDVLTNPGQTTVANLGDVMGSFETEKGAVVDLRHPRAHLEVREQKLGGWPTIEGTRVPFDVVANLIAGGDIAPADVPLYYPSVSPAAALDALDFARSLSNWTEDAVSA